MLKECPVDKWKPITGDTCPQCKTSLAPLLRVLELPQKYFEEGVRLLEQGQVDEAIAALAFAAGLEHDSRAAACAALGRAYTKKGWHREALAQFARAVELDSANEEFCRARDAAQQELHALDRAQQEQEAHHHRARRWMYLTPVAFLFGLALFPVGQKIFSWPQTSANETVAVAQAIAKSFDEKKDESIVVAVGAGPQNKIVLSGNVPQAMHEKILHAARSQVSAERLDTAGLRAIAPPPPLPLQTYIVREGDSLWIIARRVYGAGAQWKLVFEHNRDRLKRPGRLKVGQELILPPAKGLK